LIFKERRSTSTNCEKRRRQALVQFKYENKNVNTERLSINSG
jgi:hypothetical protein